ncbi:hypothetical protein A1O1_02720 [Capronia coronata CBS 617.96]|uniref:G-protein coupled receptors family 1 profile domain-containing protein n=1 Tax=Capronia coronata CBS 617.96 TaxID=1182541 RepID=W9YYG3_9EURO|nr:uncharacterized protein A1O1_02720 [Capronia coronata CBS 617.96]EXJ94326.1 hypothetical protein A1O1_02720 [Capronia coronata CBS 617.96]
MLASDPFSVASSPLDQASWKATGPSTAVPHEPNSAGGAFSGSQNRAILIAALTCSCLSLCIVLYALGIFIRKRRSFRHRLIMHLIMSNTVKAGVYFLFPIVSFAAGPVQSSSDWCQASGYVLEFGVMSADMAILIVAVHSITYILRPNSKAGEGGLYPYRNWVYLFWLGPSLLAASLAFVKGGHGYVTAGTFCYLPKRPYWYRLALSWVPRYLIIGVILAMYIWLYLYVRIKFRGFDNLGLTGSSQSSSSESRRKSSIRPDDLEKNLDGGTARPLPVSPMRPRNQDAPFQPTPAQSEPLEPWDYMNFITSKPLQGVSPAAVADEDKPPYAARGSNWSGDTQTAFGSASVIPGTLDHSRAESRKTSEAVTLRLEQGPIMPQPVPAATDMVANDPLRQTRNAIRKQLRSLFVYPAVYILMWSFPFAQHALYYDDYYVRHPVFWLNMIVSIMVSLQAGVDGLIFSLTEKTVKGEDRSLREGLAWTWSRIRAILGWGSAEEPAPQPVATGSGSEPCRSRRTPHWWEAEGRRRKDSVWLGTSTYADSISPVATRTRSRSPEKPGRVVHSRTRSLGQASLFVPTLGPISADAAELVSLAEEMHSPTTTTLTPVSSNVGATSGRLSSQSVRPAPETGAPHKASNERFMK